MSKLDTNKSRFNSKESADYIGVHSRELKTLRKAKRIPFYRIGHRTIVFDVKDLDAFLASCRVEAVA